ncbi:MarR family winged helix-turn-helix transcriptional regulator [Hazenella coriacea]|uniref:DNA-binding MarR family transcriptional regulator n=1 Tax=Hazenella coriacea TaxID=1179467 RepID=A0A4R3LAZ0_9BACL|nr:MarR family transcriptional regulator [Hazenella coriacea]TCS95454.1 DNA-binding MarR family transcriptional regulator [Hazenella coriacea]
MEKTDIFELIHTMELFTNQAIIQWTKSFPYPLGISPILTLAELQNKGPQKQSVLAHSLGFTPGAMTNIANKLIKLDYAERQFDESDRRIVYLAITDEGKRVLKFAHLKGQELRIELFKTLSESERAQLLNIYKKLLSEFKNL